MHEQRVIGPQADDADFDTMFGIPPGEAVHDVDAAAIIQVVNRPVFSPDNAINAPVS